MLQTFRLARAGQRACRAPPAGGARGRIETYFAPLPFYYPPLALQATDTQRDPLAAVTQPPMYHSGDSQNAWLRQIHAHRYLFVNPRVARAAGTGDGDWMWASGAPAPRRGRHTSTTRQCRRHAGYASGTQRRAAVAGGCENG